jgi:serine/threonine-protein phosphatase PGAM5
MWRRAALAVGLGGGGLGCKASTAAEAWNANWDLRGGADKDGRGKVVHSILLIRHGQYEQSFSAPGDDSLTKDKKRVLTSKGRLQAMQTGRRIQQMIDIGHLPAIEFVYYSTMARASETSKLIVEQLKEPPPTHKVSACSMLREGAVCQPDPPFQQWDPSIEDFIKENRRVDAGFAAHLHRPDHDKEASYTTLLVCHGNVIRYLLLRALQMDTAGWSRLAVYNASITRIDIYSDGRVSVKGVGEVGHLAPDLVTYE